MRLGGLWLGGRKGSGDRIEKKGELGFGFWPWKEGEASRAESRRSSLRLSGRRGHETKKTEAVFVERAKRRDQKLEIEREASR